MSFPKVLIFGQPFNNFTGGGITLTNLFKGWPKDRIAVTYIGHGLRSITTDVCNTYYQLGEEEHKWIFPFNLFQRKFPSGIKTIEEKSNAQVGYIKTGVRYDLVNLVFYPLLRWLGFYHFSTRYLFSERLKSWLSLFDPDIIYLQIAKRDEINFTSELIGYLGKPAVIHMMDDWPSAISDKGLFKKYWTSKIDKEFRALLDKVDQYLSISDAMSAEYKERYNKNFIAFHNPIEIESWLPFRKENFSINKDYVTILYSGRIGDNGIAESLTEVASAIDSMKNEFDANIKLHIQTPTKKGAILDILQKYKCVVINPFVDYSKIPEVFSKADLLLLANDFSQAGIKYLKLSMPTKASEYMISGTPIIVYTSDTAAVSKFFSRNECGYCITRQSKEEIQNSIKFLISNQEFRQGISRNAVFLAKEKFEASKVRGQFQTLLKKLLNKKENV